MKKAISFSISLVGFTAMSSQIVFIREFLTVFYGNELSMGLILASWFVGGAIGSSLLGRITDRLRFKISSFSSCQMVLTILLPLTVLLARSIKTFLNINPGEIIPFFPMTASSLLILAPICIILGFMFSLGCRISRVESHMAAIKIGNVYVLEAVGAITGGLATSFILIRIFNSFQIIGILCLLNIIAAIFLLISSDEPKAKPFFFNIAAIILTAAISMWLFGVWNGINEYSLRRQWQGYELVASKNSIYGNIAVAKRSGQVSFFDNGLHLYTIPDEATSEEAVHYALLEHADPKSVMLVGGGVGGLVNEILKHPVERVDYVELDPLIVEMAKDHLPAPYYEPLKDKRVSVKNEDGRLFVKKAGERYDCIIIHIGDPYTAQLNRYYTLEFFEEIQKILNKDGIVSFSLSSSESYINKELGRFLRSVYATLKNAFGDVKIIPGDTAYFLASNLKDALTYDYNVLMERAKERGLDIKYVREYYLFSKLSPEKISYMENIVKEADGVKINYDFQPVSYYYNIISWASRFRESLFTRMLKIVQEEGILKAALFLYFFILVLGLSGIRRKIFYKKAVLAAVMTTGFSQMAFQIAVLLSFQIIYGYLFYKLGLMLTSFMIGLALGGFTVIKIMPRIKKVMVSFIRAQALLSLYPLALPIFFWWLSGSKNELVSGVGSNILFPILPIIAGFIGGFQFPLANRIYLADNLDTGRVGGLSYGMDLLGSCLGAVLTGVFLIPILGIPKTCVLVSMLNIVIVILLILSSRSESVS